MPFVLQSRGEAKRQSDDFAGVIGDLGTAAGAKECLCAEVPGRGQETAWRLCWGHC